MYMQVLQPLFHQVGLVEEGVSVLSLTYVLNICVNFFFTKKKHAIVTSNCIIIVSALSWTLTKNRMYILIIEYEVWVSYI